MSAKSAYRLRDRSPAFAEARVAAQDEGVMRSFDQAMDRAMNGHLMPVCCAGRIIGVRRRYDNRLLYSACYAQPPHE